jgi:methylase of polypeptide subunit release factors
MWRGLTYSPWRNDHDVAMEADSHHDFRELPEEWTGSFDVVIFDPPHITEAGANSRYARHFGTNQDLVQHTPDIAHLYRPFLSQAARVLKKKGLVLAKLIDQVHRGRYRHQLVDYVLAVRETPGLVACEMLIKEEGRAENMVGHNWQVIHHTRRSHCYWQVAKKGYRC